VAELREERRLNRRVGVGTLQTLKRGSSIRNNLLSFGGRTGAPSLPIEAKKLVEQE